ncbi:DUF2358 domain-containing protein [Planktothricoides sp. FACHB-1370]|uniref:DUF2358 domain-containing protein n=1 Tax=Planktothricoides raciborskii FACHB-1370 TaxID=2949576 RepID=A0ABR8EA26_9CYAN|nr:DUF2358 domain-containing protein [Planktothricoides raciborskii FACHB-1370]MBD2581922.1 DUF2358 domain-containing protein [Planktothricoides raciborskii FACHB-1261]
MAIAALSINLPKIRKKSIRSKFSFLPVSENPQQVQTAVRAAIPKAIATLQQELPTLFERDLSYDIYAEDIFFKDPVNTFKGKFNYRIIFWTLRFHGRLFFTELYFDLHNVQQTKPESEPEIILANWTVRGILRLPWKPTLLFNGYSTYKLNHAGLIYEHIDTWDRSPIDILKQFWGGSDIS